MQLAIGYFNFVQLAIGRKARSRLNGIPRVTRVPSRTKSQLLQDFRRALLRLTLKSFLPLFLKPITFRRVDLSLNVLVFIRCMFPQFLIYTETPYSPTQSLLYSRVWMLISARVDGSSPQRVWHYKGNIVIKDTTECLFYLSCT